MLRISRAALPVVGRARIYVCGITPYDTTHLGHAATFVWADVATRVLRHLGVQSKVRRAAQHTVAAKIDGTPAMLVQGRYAISAEQAGREGLVKAAEQTVEFARKQK